MRLTRIALGLATALGLLAIVAIQAQSNAGSMTTLQPGSEKWMDIPGPALAGTPSVPIGGTLKVAILEGDPMTAGKSFTARISCTAGSKVAPHTHPTTENVTIVKGTFRMGMGTKWDDTKLETLPTGAFFSMPSGMTHFAQCQGDTVVQIHGIAPLRFDFK
jgi:quercetin dioxygenase-like cupin family protein